MTSVLLIAQLLLSIVLTVLVLLQRSEGGALGIGGGGGGGLMSGRSAATNIVRMTSIAGALFVANCVALTLAFNAEANRGTLVDEIAAEERVGTSPVSSEDELQQLLTTPSTPAEDDIPTVDDSSDVESTPETVPTPDDE